MAWWQILISLILIWIFYSKLQKYFLHKRIIGQRVTIKYADQNYFFETIFPRIGTITRIIKVGKRNMFILDLDTPFGFDKDDYKEIVIAERHVGSYIGAKKEIDVHVLLPKIKLTKNEYLINEFDHVVWATVKPN